MKKWLKKLAKWGVIIAVALCITGSIFQAVATRRDRVKYPAPGQFYAVNEHRLHMVCAGSASAESPTIILESGRDSSSPNWLHIVEDIGEFAHVCTYDRPGMGWSDPMSGFPESEESIDDLHTLLHDAADFEPPFIIVGHSMGGILALDYQRTYPEDIAGLVMVESSSEKQYQGWVGSEEYNRTLQLMRVSSPVGTAVSKIGLFRLYRIARYGNNPYEDLVALARRNEAHYFHSKVAQLYMVHPMVGRPDPIQTVGDTPMIVLARSTKVEADGSPRQSTGHSEWHELQHEIAALSTNSEYREVARSGHNMPIDRPDAIADAVRDLLLIIE